MGAVLAADDEFDAELTTLRRRAYGPDADFDADPIAVLGQMLELVADRRQSAEVANSARNIGRHSASATVCR